MIACLSLLVGCVNHGLGELPKLVISGSVNPDLAPNASSLTVVVGGREGHVKPDGSFSIDVSESGPCVVGVVVDSEALLMGIAVEPELISENQTHNVSSLSQLEIDHMSTAAALVFLHPNVFTTNGADAAAIMSAIMASDAVLELAEYIRAEISTYGSAEPEASLYEAAVFDVIASQEFGVLNSTSSLSPSGFTAQGSPMVEDYDIDLNRVRVSGLGVDGGRVELKLDLAPMSATSWLVAAREVDPSTYGSLDECIQPGSLDTLRLLSGGEQVGTSITGKSFFRFLNVLTLITSAVSDWLVTQGGWDTSEEGVLRFSSSEPRLLEVTASSGGIADYAELNRLMSLDAGPAGTEAANQMKLQWVSALGTNILAVVLDLVSMMVSVGEYDQILRTFVAGELATLSNAVHSGAVSSESTFRTLVVGTISTSAKTLIKALIEQGKKKAVSAVLRTVLKWISAPLRVMSLLAKGGEAAHIIGNLVLTDSPRERLVIALQPQHLLFGNADLSEYHGYIEHWSHSFVGEFSVSAYKAIATSSGGVAIVGAHTLSNHDEELIAYELDITGNVLWQEEIRHRDHVRGHAIAGLQAGGFAVSGIAFDDNTRSVPFLAWIDGSGRVTETLDLDRDVIRSVSFLQDLGGGDLLLAGGGSGDGYSVPVALRLDREGDIEWLTEIPVNGSMWVSDAVKSKSGDYYMLVTGLDHVAVARITASGLVRWTTELSTPGRAIGQSLCEAPNGDVLVAGSVIRHTGDLAVWRLDSSGGSQTRFEIGEIDASEGAGGIIALDDGGFVVLGDVHTFSPSLARLVVWEFDHDVKLVGISDVRQASQHAEGRGMARSEDGFIVCGDLSSHNVGSVYVSRISK